MLSINNLYKSFGGIQAINNVSLNIEKSTVTALIGPNGAGKTTLFNIINGSIKPDSGSIKLDDIDITSCEPHQLFNLGILRTFQIAHEFASLTVRDNLMMVPPNQINYTFCMIEHDIDFISRLCDPVIVMAEGSILMTDEISKIRKNEEVIEVYLGKN